MLTLEQNDIDYSQSISNTVQIHKLSRRHDENGATTLDFFELPISLEYVSDQRPGFDHSEKEYDCLTMMKSCCVLCLKKYVRGTELEDWLKCPFCQQWFHDICFNL